VDAALRALADQSRRAMLEALADGPATAGELAALLPIACPGVSRHLRVLREAGLVEVRREAQRRVYSLRPQPLAGSMDGWPGTEACGSSGWMPCTPRWPGGNRTKEH
jgi:DNA-binding transcriptional ArsR family regulator